MHTEHRIREEHSKGGSRVPFKAPAEEVFMKEVTFIRPNLAQEFTKDILTSDTLTRFAELVITSYSIHYTKLYDSLHLTRN